MEFASIPLPELGLLSASGNPEKDRGVVYISRIPPKMSPGILRELLTPYGPINRIFLVPKKTQEKKNAHNRHYCPSFVEGWVEFLSKKDAKRAVALLNCNPIGQKGKKRLFADDLWNLKYLSKFTWSHLTDQLTYEKAVREQKLRAELAQAKKTTQEYLQKAEKANQIRGIEKKRAKKQAKNQISDPVENEETLIEKIAQRFRQRQPVIPAQELQ